MGIGCSMGSIFSCVTPIPRVASVEPIRKMKTNHQKKSPKFFSPFTREEIQILNKQWAIFLSNPDDYGLQVFERFFTLDQTMMSKFSFSVALMLDVKKTLNDARMLFHVRRVMSVIDKVLNSLDGYEYSDTAMKYVEEIGEKHKGFGLKEENFEIFKIAFIDGLRSVIGESFDILSYDVWGKFINEIKLHMMEGISKVEMTKRDSLTK